MMVDYIANHQPEFWLVLGFVLLTIEVITGFTTGVFLFVGLGSLASGTLMWLGVLPETWIAGVSCTGISSGIITAALWRPLKRLQGDRPAGKDNSSDFVGHEFVVNTDVTASQAGSTNYSGITWKVEIDKEAGIKEIKSGERVQVTSVEVGLFKVKPT